MSVYCVTGANRGLGLEYVRQISQQDASNTIIATIRTASTNTSDLKSAANKNTHILVCNTGDSSSISSFVSEASKTLSGKKLDFLINNAGVNSVPQQNSLSIGEKDLHNEVQINVLGPAHTVAALVDAGLLSDNARIINMTSGLGSMERSLSISPRKCATYSISKAGLNMVTVHQSGDLKEKLKGVVVICMDPGWVQTRMGGDGATLTPEESIGGMLKVIGGLKEGDNGKFFQYDGENVPW